MNRPFVQPQAVDVEAIIADARDVTPRQFMDAVFGPFDREDHQMRERCIAAIKRGNTYGWPPAMVEDCQAIIAERDGLTDKVEAELRSTIAVLNHRRPYDE
jgi:hypothetical protein